MPFAEDDRYYSDIYEGGPDKFMSDLEKFTTDFLNDFSDNSGTKQRVWWHIDLIHIGGWSDHKKVSPPETGFYEDPVWFAAGRLTDEGVVVMRGKILATISKWHTGKLDLELHVPLGEIIPIALPDDSWIIDKTVQAGKWK